MPIFACQPTTVFYLLFKSRPSRIGEPLVGLGSGCRRVGGPHRHIHFRVASSLYRSIYRGPEVTPPIYRACWPSLLSCLKTAFPGFCFPPSPVTALTRSVCDTHREAEQMSQLFSGKHLSQTWLVRAVTCYQKDAIQLHRAMQPR